MTGDGRLIEVQATAERGAFTRDQLDALLDLAARGIERIGEAQQEARGGGACLSSRRPSDRSSALVARGGARRRDRRSSASCASARPGCARTCSSPSAPRSSRSSPPTPGPTSFSSGEGLVFDPTRIAAQVVTGIGFLGAGAIIRQGLSVRGLTTAATLWVVAAIGMAAGCRLLLGAVVTTALVLISLWPLRIVAVRLSARSGRRRGAWLVELPAGTSAVSVLEAVENARRRRQLARVRGGGRQTQGRRATCGLERARRPPS